MERQVNTWAKARGFIIYKFTSPSKRAVPDRIFVFPGIVEARVGWLEFKCPGEYPTPLQERELRILRKAGCHVAWTDNLQDAIYFLQILQAS